MRTPQHPACGRVNPITSRGGIAATATKLRLNEQGAIVTEGDNADVVPLTNVLGE